VISVDSRDFLENLKDRDGDGFFKASISPRCIRSWLFSPFFSCPKCEKTCEKRTSEDLLETWELNRTGEADEGDPP
jgi:uncharacterized C2H2 Zn-finger protein